VNFSTTNLIKALTSFKDNLKKINGENLLTNLNLNDIKTGKLFAVQKAIYLTRFKRTPEQVN
jgi:hypothetical protein